MNVIAITNLVSFVMAYLELEWHQLLTGIILLILGELVHTAFQVWREKHHT